MEESDMTHPIVNLREAARLLSGGQPLPEPLAVWLGASFRTFLEHQGQDLEDVLGLRWGRGGVPWWMEEAIRERDKALRALAALIAPHETASARARIVQERTIRYAGAAWPRERGLPHMPPGHAGTEREYLWRAFSCGAAMPLGDRRLRQILADEASPEAASLSELAR